MRLILLYMALVSSLFAITPQVSNADEIGSLYSVTAGKSVYGDDVYTKNIIMRSEDLVDGKIIFKGGLDSEDSNVPVEDLFVEISIDGGETWNRATGHAVWSWSFTPDLQREYETAIRVVRITSDAGVPSNALTLGGFLLALNEGTSVVNGALNGAGVITIPYLDKISTLPNTLPVTLRNLQVTNNRVVRGQVSYATPFMISTELADVKVNKIIIDATPANSKIEGSISFKGVLSSVDDMSIPSDVSLLAESFGVTLPFSGKSLAIWSEKDVKLHIGSGSLELAYTLGDVKPSLSLDVPNTQLQLGTLLTDASGELNSAVIDLQNVGKSTTTIVTQELFLLGSGLKVPGNFELTLDLTSLSDPKLSFATER